jgi:hypothetical protein
VPSCGWGCEGVSKREIERFEMGESGARAQRWVGRVEVDVGEGGLVALRVRRRRCFGMSGAGLLFGLVRHGSGDSWTCRNELLMPCLLADVADIVWEAQESL